jgi:anthranilate phosphoribosyltransferase
LVGALAALGARRAVAVRGIEGSDVMRPGRPVAFEGAAVLELPELLGARLTGDGGAAESAWLTRVVVRGEADDLLAYTVALSAGLRLYVAGLAPDPLRGARDARQALSDGRAAEALDALVG